jgi:WD40 repeat protein
MDVSHMAGMRLSVKYSTQATEADVFAVRVSDDSTLAACALSDGHLALHSHTTGRLSYTLDQSPGGFPATSVRFNANAAKTVIAASADGFVREWSTHNPRVNWTIQEDGNQVFAIDVADRLATAGLDKAVRVYDIAEQTAVVALRGHTNRVFSVLFRPGDANTLLSSGWDDAIHMWDIRTGGVARSVFGAHVCADTLDVAGDWVLSGSWRTKDQLQLWDIRMIGSVKTVRWAAEKQCLIYAAKFHPSGDFAAVGGSGAPEVRLISMKTFQTIGQPIKYPGNVYSICFAKGGNEMVVGAHGGDLKCFQFPKDAFFVTDRRP